MGGFDPMGEQQNQRFQLLQPFFEIRLPEYRTHPDSEALQTKIISQRREQATCVYNPAALNAKRKSWV